MAALQFDDLEVGGVWEGPRRTVTEADIVNFACMTGDFNRLHCDHHFAASGPFRRPVAHGLLGLAWVAGLGSNSPLVDTLAFLAVRDWQFLKPMFAGDTVQLRTEIRAKQPIGRRTGEVVWLQQLVNQDGVVVQQGEFVTLVRIARRTRAEAAESSAES